MARRALERQKWTLSFDAGLKEFLIRAARRRGMYPVALLEEIVREKFDPYGHVDIRDSVEYVRMLRCRSRRQSDAEFVEEIRRWKRSVSLSTRTS